MLCRTFSAICVGMDVVKVTIEVSITSGVGIYLVGLPDSAVKESLLRVTTALSNYDYKIPGKKVVINMAPADLRKEGSSFDTAIAIALLSASEQITNHNLENFIIIGELSLDGIMRGSNGSLSIAIRSAEMGFKACIFPREAAFEASDIDGVEVYGANNLSEVVDILNGERYTNGLRITNDTAKSSINTDQHYIDDFSGVMGQTFAKRGIEIAASGGHNVLLTGPPGAGKSYMARCLASILPPMSRKESLETSMIYSVAGKLKEYGGLMVRRPFRSPHHTSSISSLVGGGYNALPGEISLAHNGVLYLDEISNFPPHIIDILRQPLEERHISVSRLRNKVDYPASFMFVASMNPCPCGYYGETGNSDTPRQMICKCTPGMINRYRSKISGPMLDRIDINIRVKNVDSRLLLSGEKSESSLDISKRVERARNIQMERFKNDGCYTNSEMNSEQIAMFCRLDSRSKTFLNKIIENYSLSARGYNRILKISRTIADISGEKEITVNHISEAIQFRMNTSYYEQ